jgi:hypothetical protein
VLEAGRRRGVWSACLGLTVGGLGLPWLRRRVGGVLEGLGWPVLWEWSSRNVVEEGLMFCLDGCSITAGSDGAGGEGGETLEVNH